MSFRASESISRWWILVERSFCNHEEGGEDDEDGEDGEGSDEGGCDSDGDVGDDGGDNDHDDSGGDYLLEPKAFEDPLDKPAHPMD